MTKFFDKSSTQLLAEILSFSILLLILLTLVKSIFAFLATRSDNAQTGKVNLIMQHAIDSEIMIFGSSVVEVGFNSNKIAELTGSTVYNAALDGTRITQNKYLIEEFNNYSENCEKVIIGISFFSLSEEKKLTEPSRFYAYFNTSRINKMFSESDEDNYIKCNYLPFYAFTQYKHSYYKNALIGGLNLIKKKALIPDPGNGFVPHYSNWYGEEIDSASFGKRKIQFSEHSINAITDLIKEVRNRDREFIIVISPFFIHGQLAYANYDELKAKVFGFEKAGACVIDLSTLPLNLDRNYFYNNGHLNAKGALLVSSVLVDSLKTN